MSTTMNEGVAMVAESTGGKGWKPGGETGAEALQETFKSAFRRHPAGVSVITADSSEGPVGMTATSVASVSLDPPAVTFSLSALSSTAPRLLGAESVVVHLMDSRGRQTAQRFAAKGVDRFAEIPWQRLPTGEPLLQEAAAWFRGTIASTCDIGGSTVAVLEIHDAGTGDPRSDQDSHVSGPAADPLVYCNRTWHQLNGDSVMD